MNKYRRDAHRTYVMLWAIGVVFTVLFISSCPAKSAEPAPKFVVTNNVPPTFVVVNKIPAVVPPAPVREFWGGTWGWMERGADGVYRQVSGPGGAAVVRPFPPDTTPRTTAQSVAVPSTQFPVQVQSQAVTRTLAPRVIHGGIDPNCTSYG